MMIVVLEAAVALVVLLFVVWWTMFAGRHRGELPDDANQADRGGHKKLKG
jgi:hypothetical protein